MPMTADEVATEHMLALASLTDEQRRAMDRWVAAQTMASFSLEVARARLELGFQREAAFRSGGELKPH